MPSGDRAGTLYFAYGSNLSIAAMRVRAPGARPLIAAVLANHRLTFESNEPEGSPEGFFANVRVSIGDTVPGAVYEVDASDMLALDAYEDIDRDVYRRVDVEVTGSDGKPRRAIVYRMPVEGRPIREGAPSAEQIRQIRAGYADWRLDERVLELALRA